MKQLICLSLALTMTLQSTLILASPKEKAQEAIQSSLAKARADAFALVSQDFLNAMLELMAQTKNSGEPSLAFATYQNQMAALESKMQNLSVQIRENRKPDMIIAKQIWESYTDMARERFGISFKAQNELSKTNQTIEIAERTIDKFESTCKAGRSEFGLSYDTVQAPNLPAANVTIMLNYGWGEGGKMGSVTTADSTSTGNDEARNSFGAVINTTAGVANSVAFTGGTGAMVANITTVAPYLAGAAIIYATYAHFAAAAEQAALQKDVVDANLQMFEQIADAKDVAGYYREACTSFVGLTAALRKVLVDIRRSEDSRLKVLSEAAELRPAIEQFGVDSEKHKLDSEVIQLLYNAQSGRCPNFDAGKKQSEVSCVKTSTGYESRKMEGLKIPLDLKESDDLLQSTKDSLAEFAKTYPQSKQVDLMAAQMALVFGADWQEVESSMVAFSFESVDGLMSSLFQKVQKVLADVRALEAAAWEDPNDPLKKEIVLFNQLEELRRSHRLLVAEAIKVIFNRAEKSRFLEKVRAHAATTTQFARKYGSKSKGLRSLDSAAKRLLKIAGTL